MVSVARSLKIPGGIVDLLSSTLELPKWLREREREKREREGEGIRGAHRIDETRTEKGGIYGEGKRQVGRGMRETHSISILSPVRAILSQYRSVYRHHV